MEHRRWGVGGYGLDAWLAGRSLADSGTLDERQCKLSLAGLGVAFRKLFAARGDRAFAAAQTACGRLGLYLPEVDATTRGYFERHVVEEQRHEAAELSSEQAIAAIRKTVILGAEDAEPENDPAFFERLLGDPEGYRYTALARLVGADGKTKGGQTNSPAVPGIRTR